MKLNDLHEGVVDGNFGAGGSADIDIPVGYETFFTKEVSNKVSAVYGVKADGSEHKINTAHTALAHALAKHYNSGGKADTGMKPVSMMDAFGSEFEKALNKVTKSGMTEKPTSFNDIDKEITYFQLKQIEKQIGQSLPLIKHEDYFQGQAAYPTSNVQQDIPRTAIVLTPNGKYIADRGGSKSYSRMWLKLTD